MKKYILILLVAILLLSGCTIEEPGFVNIANEPNVKVVDADGDIIGIDSATGTLQIINYEHHEIHAGNAYYVTGNQEALGDGDTFELTVITPDTAKWLNTIWAAEGVAAIHIFIYEGATTNVPGVVIPAVNRDRNSAKTSDAILREDDTFTDLGTLLWEWHTGDKKTIGLGGERDELILRQGTQYLLRIESEAVGNSVSGILSWYEHESKD